MWEDVQYQGVIISRQKEAATAIFTECITGNLLPMEILLIITTIIAAIHLSIAVLRRTVMKGTLVITIAIVVKQIYQIVLLIVLLRGKTKNFYKEKYL